jgi:serine/threonine protein kinase/Flp pilus assembly protein TadD
LPDFDDELKQALAGHYTIDHEIGRGGMARVYLAHDVRHNRPVAVKVLHPELGAAIGAERFLREIQVIARLRHPHIVPLYDSGEAAGRVYYVMPFVNGESVRQRLSRNGPFPPDEAARLVGEVADALEYAHREGVIHRDIKPDNIMLDDRHALVMDFGIARAVADGASVNLTGTGLLVGTPTYMSPEQVTGDAAIDGRSDIYSLGCVLYEMLAGKPPFSGPSSHAVMAMRFSAPTPSLDGIAQVTSPALRKVIAKSMTLAPADRYQSARDMRDQLEASRTSTSQETFKPETVTSTTPQRETAPPNRSNRGPIRYGIWALRLLPVLAAAGVLFIRFRPSPSNDPASASNAASIGVLPFANQSGDKQLDYFSDGLTDELIGSLSHVGGLQVAGRASSFSIKGRNLSSQEAAKRLQVAYLVDAGVRSGGSHVRVSWQLIDGKTGRGLTGGDLDGDAKDVIALQDSMAKKIVEGLQPVLGKNSDVAFASTLGHHRTADYEAHDLYLKGHFYWNQRTAETMRQGILYLKQAIAKDPAYAMAWAELSSAYTIEPTFGDMTPAEVMQPARDAAKKAMELDPTLAEANTAMGMSITFNDWNPREALPYLEKAIALDPQNSFPRLFRSWPLLMVGRFDEALAEIRRARALDPLSPILNTRVGTMLNYQNRYSEAEKDLKRVVAADPGNLLAHFELGTALAAQKKFTEAFAVYPDAIDTEVGGATSSVAWAYGQAGMPDSARAILTRLKARAKQRYISPLALAVAADASGDRDAALTYMESAVREHSFFLVFIQTRPEFASLRPEPRFQRVLAQVTQKFH